MRGMPVMGMPAAPEAIARYDDLGVARLRDAGAMIVGTNTMMGTSSPGLGQFNWDAEARNPWDRVRRDGRARAGRRGRRGMLPITIGSDGGGSTRLPAPTRVWSACTPPPGSSPATTGRCQMRRNPTGTIGPLARDVRDTAITLQAMAGPDGRDFDCIQTDAPDCWPRSTRASRGCASRGPTTTASPTCTRSSESPRVIDDRPRRGAGPRRARRRDRRRSTKRGRTSGPGTSPRTTSSAVADGHDGTSGAASSGSTPWTYATGTGDKFRNGPRASTTCSSSPTAQLVAPTIEDWADYWAGNGPVPFPHGTFAPHYTSHTHMFNWLGFPAVSVPAGFVDGLPVGLQIVGWPGTEDMIFRVAQTFLDTAGPRPERPPIS